MTEKSKFSPCHLKMAQFVKMLFMVIRLARLISMDQTNHLHMIHTYRSFFRTFISRYSYIRRVTTLSNQLKFDLWIKSPVKVVSFRQPKVDKMYVLHHHHHLSSRHRTDKMIFSKLNIDIIIKIYIPPKTIPRDTCSWLRIMYLTITFFNS